MRAGATRVCTSMTKRMLALAAVLLAACQNRAPQVIALPSPADAPRPGVMTVTGQATLDISPDCADITITLDAETPRPGAATSAVDAKETKLVAALDKLGVARGDLKLSTLTLEPVYDYEEHRAPRLRGYRAQLTITATTRDFTKIGGIVDAGADAGAFTLSTAFRRSDLPVLKKQVRAMALAAAKDKARQTADALGIELGRVVTVAETPNGVMWGNAYFPSNTREVRESRDLGGGGLGGALQSLTLDVTVGYELAKAS